MKYIIFIIFLILIIFNIILEIKLKHHINLFKLSIKLYHIKKNAKPISFKLIN